jgi:D-3-phosphoglycerate dehydrogenase
VIVTSSVGVNTASVVEHAVALMFALFKQLTLMDRETRRNNFGIRYRNYPRDVKGKCLGVVGFGRIGSAFAELCHKAFRMRVVAHDPYLDESAKARAGTWAGFVSLEEVFRQADVVSVHIPLTEKTEGIVDISSMRLMKPGAFLINTSRGGVVREPDLIRALQEKLLAGAGIDVFEMEPPDKENPLLRMESVILTPHTAALTGECVLEMAVKAVERVIDLMDGYLPENVANPEVLAQDIWKGLRARSVTERHPSERF